MIDNLQIRLCFREEGSFWVAYLAQRDTLEGMFAIGSISMEAVRKSPVIKAQFIDIMKQIVEATIEETTGRKASWGDLRAAPAHERPGQA